MDRPLRDRFLGLSHNEQVSLCHQVGEPSAHHGMTPAQLWELLESGTQGPEDPVDAYRRDVMTFIDDHKGRLTMSCDGNCHAHSAAKVFQCHQLIMEIQENNESH